MKHIIIVFFLFLFSIIVMSLTRREGFKVQNQKPFTYNGLFPPTHNNAIGFGPKNPEFYGWNSYWSNTLSSTLPPIEVYQESGNIKQKLLYDGIRRISNSEAIDGIRVDITKDSKVCL